MINTSYQELLKTPEWGNKKVEILKRDDYTCQRCGTGRNKIIKTTKIPLNNKDEISFASYNLSTKDCRKMRLKLNQHHQGIPFKSHLSITDLREHKNLVLLLQFVRKNHFTYPYVATLGKINFDSELNDLVNNDIIFNYLWRKNFVKSPELDIDLEGIYILDEKECSESAYSKNHILLEVHHKCYRRNLPIWAQSNDEYVTLCNVCHDIIHENQNIPFFDVYENIEPISDCGRCNGKGYLPHYRHVQNGVCFKCTGWGKQIE